jgi:hypothetical protein
LVKVNSHPTPTPHIAHTVVVPHIHKTGVVLALSGYLKEYGSVVVSNAAETRNLIQNRLLEISRCGDPKHELKALELLGKMSDIGVFTEKSELVITHKTANELKEAIRDKINRLLNSDVIDVESFSDGLEEELNLDEPEEVEQVEEPEQVEEHDSDDPK